MGKKCDMNCLNCKLPQCKYDKYTEKSEKTRCKEPQTEVAKSAKRVIVHPKKGRPRKYEEGTYWENYSREHREELNAKERARYWNNREEKLAKCKKWRDEHKGYYIEYGRKRREALKVTEAERVRALLGNLKNQTWDVNPVYPIEKEESDAIRAYIKDLEDSRYSLSQRVQELEEKLYSKV